MNCWHCQKALPENYSATYCPHCGRDLPDPTGATLSEPLLEEPHTNWPKFFVLLILPAVITFITMMIKAEEIAVMVGLAGSLICGLICARMVMTCINTSGFGGALLHFIMAVVLCGLSLFISIAGCAFGASIPIHGR